MGGLPHGGNQEEEALAKDLSLKVIRMSTSQGLKDEEGRNKPAYEAFKKAVEQYRKR